MCGIAGIWCEQTLSPQDLVELNDRAERMRYRGPEQCGAWNNGRVALVHNRLILRDPHMGQQPMVSASGCVLAYNGELFNHNELKAELCARGKVFRGDSDTEVVLYAYDVWGNEAWKRLNGMFAFVLFDEKQASLLLVRDALGTKPLYYKRQGQQIEFASEPTALSKPVQPHLEGLVHYLKTARNTNGAATLLHGVAAVEPGTCVRLSPTQLTIEHWAHVNRQPAISEKLEHEQKAQVRFLLERSVGNQSAVDYPFGLCLSGGVDSAILCALLAQQGRSFTAYSISLEADTDDLDAARAYAATRRVPFVGTELSAANFFASMRELIALRNQPLCYANDVLIYELAKVASRSVKVLLSGEGADELFGGYSKLLAPVAAFADAQRSPFKALKLSAISATYPDADLTSAARFVDSLMTWWNPADLKSCLKAPLRELADATQTIDTHADDHTIPADPLSILMTTHLPNLLQRLDNAMMAASVEGRMPFTDAALVAFVLEQRSFDPLNVKWQNKALLKSTFSDCLSPCLLKKPKRPFDANLSVLFSTQAGQTELGRLNSAEALALIFDMDALRMWRARNDESRTLHLLWQLINLNTWLMQNIS